MSLQPFAPIDDVFSAMGAIGCHPFEFADRRRSGRSSSKKRVGSSGSSSNSSSSNNNIDVLSVTPFTFARYSLVSGLMLPAMMLGSMLWPLKDGRLGVEKFMEGFLHPDAGLKITDMVSVCASLTVYVVTSAVSYVQLLLLTSPLREVGRKMEEARISTSSSI